MLPILWGDTLAGRLDMKADRKNGALLVPGAFAEADVPPAELTALAHRVAPELLAMAAWLGLQRVEVGERGDLACALAAAVGHYARH